MKKFALLLAVMLCACSPQAPAGLSLKDVDALFADPPADCRPFVRWWWNGDRVEEGELVRELHLLKEAGIGGVEINPIAFPYGGDTTGTRELLLASEEWTELFRKTCEEAAGLGMQCDLLLGSGWPFGAEYLPMEERASVMLTNAIPLEGGIRFETTADALCKAVDPGVTVPNLERRYTLEKLLLAPDPISDISEAEDVSGLLSDGHLVLDVPAGPHYLYALVRYDSFACVINGAPGAAGSILNHLDAKAVRRYLDHQADAIEHRIGPLHNFLRSFFVDSMELEGCNWCADMPEEFLRRRGYDLMPWLPFTMFKVGRLGEAIDYNYGAAKSPEFAEKVNRVRFDFELTKAELLHERYTSTFLAWCRKKGVKSRAQAYGRGFLPLESSLGYDIPEGESWTTNWLRHRLGEEMGDADYRRGRGYTMINKYVSSAANLCGRREVSSEEMTNTYRVFSTSLELLKIGSDMGVFSGTTHPVWSGYNYSPPQAAFPGWVQYGSYSHENNPWWPYWRLLNDYRARVSLFLRNADMVTDIAILPANYDLWTSLGVQTDPFPWYLNVPWTSLIWEAVHKNGGGADYLSDKVLAACKVRGGRLFYGPKSYGVLILPEVHGLTEEVLGVLESFVRSGGRVFCIGCRPDRSLGFKDFEARDAALKARVTALAKAFSDRLVQLPVAEDNAWLEWYADVQESYGLPHALNISAPDRFLLQNHYRMDDGTHFFLLSNVSLSEEHTSSLLFDASVTGGRPCWVFDAASGLRYSIDGEVLADGSFRCSLSLGPSQTLILAFGDLPAGRQPLPSSSAIPAWQPLPAVPDDAVEVGDWSVRLQNPLCSFETSLHMPGLQDLQEIFPSFSGQADYSTVITFADGAVLPRFIDLGKVCEIATLKVNGVEAGTRWFGRPVFDISGLLHPGENTLEVSVRTLICNYMLSMPENPVVRRFMTGPKKGQSPVPSGLLGPVLLY